MSAVSGVVIAVIACEMVSKGYFLVPSWPTRATTVDPSTQMVRLDPDRQTFSNS